MTVKANNKDWKAMLSCVKTYTDEATVTVGGGKAKVLEMDLAKNHLIYGEIDCEGEAVFSINLEKFMKGLSAVGDDPEIEVGDGYLTIYGKSAKVKVPLIVRESTAKWPEKFQNPSASCEIDPSILDPVVSYGVYCSQAIAKFSIADTKMRVEIGVAPDVSEVESMSTAVGNATSTFGLDLIETIVKHVKSFPTVKVEGFNDNWPMIFSWKNDGTGNFKVLIAPRIEE